MYIEDLGNIKKIKCKQCGYSRGKSKNKNNITTMYGIWSDYSKGKEADYVLCKECLNKIFDCVRNIKI